MAFTAPTALPESANVDVMHFSLSRWDEARGGDGLVLDGRGRGDAARADLQRELLGHRSGSDPVGIDLRGVRTMSLPFAVSFFVPLLSAGLYGYYDEHPIVVFGANDDVSETLDVVMRMHNMGVISQGHESSTELLGGEPSLKATVAAATKLRRFSATDLGVELGISPQAANNRLKALVRMGALVRVPVVVPGGGREFAYQVPTVTPTG